MSEAGTVWTLVLADPEPQVPEAKQRNRIEEVPAEAGTQIN